MSVFPGGPAELVDGFSVATADSGLPFARQTGGWSCVLLIGAIPGQARLDARLPAAIERAWAAFEVQHGEGPDRALARLARGLDEAARGAVGGSGAEATFIAALIRDDTVWLARTGHAVALLVRDGALIGMPDACERPTSAWSRWLGEGGPVQVDAPPDGLVLWPGDRLVLSTLAVGALGSPRTVRRMVGEGSTEAAAQTLAGALGAHRGVEDVAVAVCACGEPDPAEHEALPIDASVFSSLLDVLTEITEEHDPLARDTAPTASGSSPVWTASHSPLGG